MPKHVALQGFSAAIEECLNHTAALTVQLQRLSDAEVLRPEADIKELTTAVIAISNAVRGVTSVAQLEAGRNGL